ncbi:hypothetical protein G9O61_00g020710 [Vairimorpha ceranae]|nr:hypothetical protein G9O61_00g020710 [Vairimorpha ceranae]
MLSRKCCYILLICLVSTTFFICIFCKYTSIFGSHSDSSTKISLKDTVLDKFDTDIAFEAYKKIHKEIKFTKEEFVFMAKAYYCIFKIPKNVLEKYLFDAFTLYDFFFIPYTEKVYPSAVELIMDNFLEVEKSSKPELFKIVQKTIDSLDTILNSLLEDDLKIKLTERKLERGTLMLSYIEIAFFNIKH